MITYFPPFFLNNYGCQLHLKIISNKTVLKVVALPNNYPQFASVWNVSKYFLFSSSTKWSLNIITNEILSSKKDYIINNRILLSWNLDWCQQFCINSGFLFCDYFITMSLIHFNVISKKHLSKKPGNMKIKSSDCNKLTVTKHF